MSALNLTGLCNSHKNIEKWYRTMANKTESLLSHFTSYQVKAGEEYMNPKQLEHFKNILLLWKKELVDEVSRTMTHMQEDVTNFADPNDRASQEEEFSLELRTRERECKLVNKIDETLELIEKHEYGFCNDCGIEIGIRRMEVRPTATLCIDCKTLSEIKERQLGKVSK